MNSGIAGGAQGDGAGTPAGALPYLTAEAVLSVSYAAAADALADALRAGLDLGAAPARSIVPVSGGQVLTMPAEVGGWVGVKVVSISPENPAHGRPRIQGSFLLLDAETLAPRAVLDGVALTNLRTPALSVLAARYLAGPGWRGAAADAGPDVVTGGDAGPGAATAGRDAATAGDAGPDVVTSGRDAATAGDAGRGAAGQSGHGPGAGIRLLVFGTGPQAEGHILALAELFALADIAIISRDERHAADLVARLRGRVPAQPRVGGDADLAAADIVVCATTARTPLFAADQVRPGSLVIAVGSHEPDVLELDAALLSGAQVIVEDPATALREAGEIATAAAAGIIAESDLIPLADLVTGRVVGDPLRTRVFKSVGMAWEDVAVASSVWRG